MNKKQILALAGAAGTLTALLLVVDAQAIDLGRKLATGAATQGGYSGATNDTTLAQTIGSVIKIALSFVGTIFLLLTIYAGFIWMNARGDSSAVEKAQGILRTAVIGLIITVGSYSITNFVVPRIVERTAGGQPTGGGAAEQAGGEMVGCCEVCPPNNNVDCRKFATTGVDPALAQDACEGQVRLESVGTASYSEVRAGLCR
ncbi:MAG: hypothetical protein HOE53_00695 [Candidatus Magasanikbacteria bacterium]|jgi:hypothetical protein|nr:hypothetical protein [Candidatus Magasanikbacteria bacterium]